MFEKEQKIHACTRAHARIHAHTPTPTLRLNGLGRAAVVSKKADFLATSEAHDSSPNDLPQTPDGTADNSALIFVEAGTSENFGVRGTPP